MNLLPTPASSKDQARHRREMRNSSNIKTSDETSHNIPSLQDSWPVTSLSNLDPNCYSINLFSLALSLRKNNSSHFFCMWQKKLRGLYSFCSKPGSSPGWRPESFCWEESCPRAGFLCQIISRKTKMKLRLALNFRCLYGSYVHLSFSHTVSLHFFLCSSPNPLQSFLFFQIQEERRSRYRKRRQVSKPHPSKVNSLLSLFPHQNVI